MRIKERGYCRICKEKEHIRNCSICEKLYNVNDCYYFCKICLSGCRVKCQECYNEQTEDEEILFSRQHHLIYYWLEM